MMRLPTILLVSLGLAMPAWAMRTVSVDRPTHYAPDKDAIEKPIEASTALGYRFFIGATLPEVQQVDELSPVTDTNIQASFTDAQLPVGYTICVSAFLGASESGKTCAMFLPPKQPPTLYMLSE